MRRAGVAMLGAAAVLATAGAAQACSLVQADDLDWPTVSRNSGSVFLARVTKVRPDSFGRRLGQSGRYKLGPAGALFARSGSVVAQPVRVVSGAPPKSVSLAFNNYPFCDYVWDAHVGDQIVVVADRRGRPEMHFLKADFSAPLLQSLDLQ